MVQCSQVTGISEPAVLFSGNISVVTRRHLRCCCISCSSATVMATFSRSKGTRSGKLFWSFCKSIKEVLISNQTDVHFWSYNSFPAPKQRTGQSASFWKLWEIWKKFTLSCFAWLQIWVCAKITYTFVVGKYYCGSNNSYTTSSEHHFLGMWNTNTFA